MNHMLKRKIEELDVELDILTKEITMTTTRIKDTMKFEKNTEMLDEVRSSQRSPLDKTELGYDNRLKTTSSTKEKTQLSTKEDEVASTKCK